MKLKTLLLIELPIKKLGAVSLKGIYHSNYDLANATKTLINNWSCIIGELRSFANVSNNTTFIDTKFTK